MAPLINSVIREAAIIEFGGRPRSEEVDHFIKRIADGKGNNEVEKGPRNDGPLK
jgi:hypothetical protein